MRLSYKKGFIWIIWSRPGWPANMESFEWLDDSSWILKQKKFKPIRTGYPENLARSTRYIAEAGIFDYEGLLDLFYQHCSSNTPTETLSKSNQSDRTPLSFLPVASKRFWDWASKIESMPNVWANTIRCLQRRGWSRETDLEADEQENDWLLVFGCRCGSDCALVTSLNA